MSMTLALKNIRLRLVELADAAFILELRTDSVLSQFLNQTENDIAKQERWLHQYKQREQKKEEYYFIIEDRVSEEKLGTIRLYNIKGNQYTAGSWIIKKGTPEEVAFISDFLIAYFGIEILAFERCYFDVRKDNKKVLAFHKRFARIVGEDDLNYYLEIDKQGYEKKKSFYLLILNSSIDELVLQPV